MFEPITRPLVPHGPGGSMGPPPGLLGHHPPSHPPPPPHMIRPPLLGPGPPPGVMLKPLEPESSWERGLRHAKEIIKQSVKRKETDVDFEEKRMNLSLAQDEDELDKENADFYVRKGGTPAVLEDAPAIPTLNR